MFNLGAAYYNGDGVQIDDDLSYAWFALAKEAGSSQAVEAVARAESQLPAWRITDGYKRIARLCEDGVYAPGNQAQAASWWLKAAIRGDKEAQVAIANKLLNGEGVPQDFARARYWCSEIAKDGEATGQFCLGHIYQKGLGVPTNAKTARRWYQDAANQGHIAAIRALAQMDETGEGANVDLTEAFVLYAELALAKDKGAAQAAVRVKNQMTAKQWKQAQKLLPTHRVDPQKLDALLQSATP